MLQGKKQLTAKKPLVAKTALKVKPKKRKYKRLEQKNAQELVKVVDEIYSRYVRLRDASYTPDGTWRGKCITCGKWLIVRYEDGSWNKYAQNGHFITRGVHSLRFTEENTNLQCSYCNAWRDKNDTSDRYRKAIELKYGDGVWEDLMKRSKAEGAFKRPKKAELLQIMADSREYIAHCEQNPDNYAIDNKYKA